MGTKAPASTLPVLDVVPKTEPVTNVIQIRYSDDEELNNAITYDEDLNRLQASLLRYLQHQLC